MYSRVADKRTIISFVQVLEARDRENNGKQRKRMINVKEWTIQNDYVFMNAMNVHCPLREEQNENELRILYVYIHI